MITVTTPQWDGLLRAVGRDELVGDPDLDTPQQRGRNGGALMKEIAAFLATLPTDEVVDAAHRGTACRARRSPTSTRCPTSVEATSPGYLVREVHPQLGEMLHPRPRSRSTSPWRSVPRPRSASTPTRSSPSSAATAPAGEPFPSGRRAGSLRRTIGAIGADARVRHGSRGTCCTLRSATCSASSTRSSRSRHCRDVVAAVSKAGGPRRARRGRVQPRAARDRAELDRRATSTASRTASTP